MMSVFNGSTDKGIDFVGNLQIFVCLIAFSRFTKKRPDKDWVPRRGIHYEQIMDINNVSKRMKTKGDRIRSSRHCGA
jgi:hypothetical protein